MEELQYQRDALNKEGSSTEAVDKLVLQIVSCQSKEEVKDLFGILEKEADKLGWPRDRDYAAVALQHESKNASNEVCIEMLKFAISRAELCASCATAGGEGIARSSHIRELEKLINNRFL